MLFCLGWWLTRRDWRAGVAVLCVAAGWLTWLPFTSRTKFDYYSLEFVPFLILCITLCLGLIIGPASGEPATPCDRLRHSLARTSLRFYPVLVFLSDPLGADHPVLVSGCPTCGTTAGSNPPQHPPQRSDRPQRDHTAGSNLALNIATYLKVILVTERTVRAIPYVYMSRDGPTHRSQA